MMITPEEKDRILLNFTNSDKKEFLQISPQVFNLDTHTFGSLLRQFDKRGFIKLKGGGGRMSDYVLSVEIEADDFLQRGGYKFEEDIFRNSFIKLELELAKLEKENPTINFENATKLVGAVASGFDIYKHLNP